MQAENPTEIVLDAPINDNQESQKPGYERCEHHWRPPQDQDLEASSLATGGVWSEGIRSARTCGKESLRGFI